MRYRLIATVLAGRLACAPFAAADEPPAGPVAIRAATLAVAASRQADSAARPNRGPMPRGLKWTGWALIAGGTLEGLAAASDDCNRARAWCRNRRTAKTVGSGLMLGTGTTLLLVGRAKRSRPGPSLVVGDGRAVVQQRITF